MPVGALWKSIVSGEASDPSKTLDRVDREMGTPKGKTFAADRAKARAKKSKISTAIDAVGVQGKGRGGGKSNGLKYKGNSLVPSQ